MTSFDGDRVRLTFVFCDSGVDAVYEVGTDGSFEDCGERDCGTVGGGGAWGEDVDLRTSCLQKCVSRNFRGKVFINASIIKLTTNEPEKHSVRLKMSCTDQSSDTKDVPFYLTMDEGEKTMPIVTVPI